VYGTRSISKYIASFNPAYPKGWKKEHLDPPDTEQTLTEEHLDCSVSSKESRSAWARLIARVYEVNPLECPTCHSEMRIIAVITHQF